MTDEKPDVAKATAVRSNKT